MTKKGIKYYFRGTTLGYPGNSAHRKLPVTPTTLNPAKAVVFAMLCNNWETRVIYIAKATALKTIIARKKNVFAKWEEEVGFAVKPADFTKFCEGYISLADGMKI